MSSASLAELQDALAALATSNDDEAPVPEVLTVLPAVDLRRYARGLRQKRWDDVAATVPLAASAIGDLHARYDAWLRAHPPPAQDTVLPPGAAEALRALPALAHGVAGDPGQAPYAADLLVFEVLAACSRADGTRRTLRARYPIHDLIVDLRAGLIPVDPPVNAQMYTFDRRGARPRPLP